AGSRNRTTSSRRLRTTSRRAASTPRGRSPRSRRARTSHRASSRHCSRGTSGSARHRPRRPTWRSEERRVGKECRARWAPCQAEDGIRYFHVTGVQTCALPICWFEEQDDIEQAFAHYIAAGRIDAAREIAEVAAGAYFAQGKFETLLAWNERLSQTQAEAPNLALVCATIYGDRCEYEAAQEELERARCGFQASGDEEGVSKARLQQARLHLQQGDDHRAIEDAEA